MGASYCAVHPFLGCKGCKAGACSHSARPIASSWWVLIRINMVQAELILSKIYEELGDAACYLHDNQNHENSAKVADICKLIQRIRGEVLAISDLVDELR